MQEKAGEGRTLKYTPQPSKLPGGVKTAASNRKNKGPQSEPQADKRQSEQESSERESSERESRIHMEVEETSGNTALHGSSRVAHAVIQHSRDRGRRALSLRTQIQQRVGG